MPFAGYEDFSECVADNQDKDDPEAFCAAIQAEVEGEDDRDPDVIELELEPAEKEHPFRFGSTGWGRYKARL